MPTIIVTGAAGFLGFYLARALSKDSGNIVHVVDNFSRGEADREYLALCEQENVIAHDIDLNDQMAVATLPNTANVIYHMAALNGTQNFYERPFEVVRSCTLPTVHLLDHLGRGGSKPRFIYAGTSEAYAATVTRFGWDLPTAEDVPLCIEDPFNPRWSYAASKMHGEVATINGCRFHHMPFTVVRYHNAYGPRMGDKHVVPDFLSRAGAGRFELFGYADTRSFLYADDAVAATIALANTPAADGEIVHVGSMHEITILELGELMMKVCGFEGEIVKHPSPAGSVKRRLPDVNKARSLIGSFETVSLEEGLRRTAKFYLSGELAA